MVGKTIPVDFEIAIIYINGVTHGAMIFLIIVSSIHHDGSDDD